MSHSAPAQRFASIIGYSVNMPSHRNVEYKPEDNPLLLISDDTGKHSSETLQKITEDALLSGWHVVDVASQSCVDAESYEQKSVYTHKPADADKLLHYLHELIDYAKQHLTHVLDSSEGITGTPLRTILIIQDVQKYSRSKNKEILHAVCKLLHFASTLELGVVVSSNTPKMNIVQQYGIPYFDLRFDKNSFQSAYTLSERQRFDFNQLKEPRRYGYLHCTKQQTNTILLPAPSRSGVTQTLNTSIDLKAVLKKLWKGLEPESFD